MKTLIENIKKWIKKILKIMLMKIVMINPI